MTQAYDTSIANHAFNTPERYTKSKTTLVSYLTKPYNNDYDKLQSIAYWIASHIAYDSYKYNNGKTNERAMQYHYDILEARAGICSDFALLFSEMAQNAGIKNVEYVTGYVLENQYTLKRKYRQREFKNDNGHTWNKVTIDKRSFFVDTTFMAPGSIGNDRKSNYVSSFKHKSDIAKRTRTHRNEVNTNINEFYWDFTPKDELHKYNRVHVSDKYISE